MIHPGIHHEIARRRQAEFEAQARHSELVREARAGRSALDAARARRRDRTGRLLGRIRGAAVAPTPAGQR